MMNEPQVLKYKGAVYGYYIDQDPDDGRYYGDLYDSNGKTIKDDFSGETYRDCELKIQKHIGTLH